MWLTDSYGTYKPFNLIYILIKAIAYYYFIKEWQTENNNSRLWQHICLLISLKYFFIIKEMYFKIVVLLGQKNWNSELLYSKNKLE